MNVAFNWVSVLSSVAVAAFAAVQVFIMFRNESTRRDERLADELLLNQVAYATVHAEWFRIWTTAQFWSGVNLREAALASTFDPDDILPRDWGAIVPHLGRLGILGARMASLGLAYAYDAWKVARVFADEAKAVEELQRGVLVNMTSTADLASLESMALKVVTLANEAAAVLEDALEHAPAHAIEGRGAINANPRSEAVRRMKTAFETLSAEATRTTIREE